MGNHQSAFSCFNRLLPEKMKLTLGLLALLAFGQGTVLAGPLKGEEITEGEMEPDIDLEFEMEPEVQVNNRKDAKIADRQCKANLAGCKHNSECCSKQCSAMFGFKFVCNEMKLFLGLRSKEDFIQSLLRSIPN